MGLEQQHFHVGTHVLIIDVEDIYFLTKLSRRGILFSLSGPRGGDVTIYDLIDGHCVIKMRSQGGKNPIKHNMDRPLRMVSFTIEKVARSRASHWTTWACMLYALECMAPTIFN